MATATLYPSALDDDHSYSSANNISNIPGNSATATTYGQFYLNTGSRALTYFYLNFDTSVIPSGATIDSVSCQAKAYVSSTSTSYISARTFQLYSGSNAKGSTTTISSSTSTATTLSDTGNWTYDEITNIKLRVSLTRGTSQTTTSRYIRFYGATLTIEYTDNATKYTVTVSSNGVSVDKEGDYQVREGNPFSVSILGDVTSVTDNSVEVINNLTTETSPETESTTSYPTAYTTSGSISGTRYTGAIGMGSDNTVSGNDYSGSSGSTATIIYSFDFSSIPSDATIESVSVTVGGHLESTSNSSEVAELQLYSGNTVKGSQTKFTSTSKQLITMDAGTWTRDELQNATLHFTIGYYGGLVNGVDFVVTYSTPRSGQTYKVYTITNVGENHVIVISNTKTGTNLFIKINGSYKEIKMIYKKQNGVYTEEKTENLPTNIAYVYKT